MRSKLSGPALALLLGLLAATLSGDASAAPTARFTATPVQGSVCVAPCVVHLDATATTATDTTRPFHELDYAWDCGEPGAGTWPTKLGGDKNSPRGPISGCVYETPGTKTIRLTARSNDGTSHATTQNVTVTSPRTQFGGTGTYCFRSTATGDFLGCPLDADSNGSCELDPGGHCATQASFTTALTTCGANTAQRGCYFRRGDTFTGGSTFILHGGGTTPGMVGAFGPTTRPRPILAGASGLVSLRDRWTVSGLTVQMASGQPFSQIGPDESNLTVYQVAASGPFESCLTTGTGGGTQFNDLIAAVELDCNATAIVATAMFLRAERGLVLGTRVDNNGTGEFNLRTVHWWKGAIQHTDLIAPGNPANGGAGDRNPLQIRAWAQATGDEAPSGNGPPPKETRWVTISDDYFEWHGGGNAGTVIRTCQNNDCGGEPGGTGSGAPKDVVDLLIERNFVAFDGTDSTANLAGGLVWAQGGRMTVRNNVLDLQGISGTSGRNRLLRQSPTYSDCVGCTGSEIVVQNNTVYYDEALGDPFDLCELSEGAGHVCQLNLTWRPSDTASGGAEAPSVPAATGGNLWAAGTPFASTPLNRGLTMPSQFQLSATSAARNRLASPSRDIVIDNGGRCRGTGSIDAGAWEQGATACPGATATVCGNAVIEAGETCDDGNTAAGDGCSATCQVEPPVCGNARREGSEACDDGNAAAGDGCRANCTIERCGDLIVDPGRETCDDGNTAAGDGCSATCFIEPPVCGNGRREGSEACDDGNAAAGDGCRANCTIERCGDHIVDPGRETCDDGNTAAGDGCSAICFIEPPVCGNGRREGSEACDDGNTVAGDGCSATCSTEPAICGNGSVEFGEACDDGNAVAGDGCRADCSEEVCGDRSVDVGEMCDDGNQVGGDGCRPDCTTEACGNDVIDAAEGCDDGNIISGDGCSATCLVEVAPGAGLYRLNVGGGIYTDPSAQLWSPDTAYASGGRIATHSLTVFNTTSDPLFQSRRYGAPGAPPVTFELPVPTTGPYRVRLHFAELEPASYGVGRRVFDVVLEETFRMESVDVFVAAGGAQRAYVRDYYLNVDDGSLSIRLEPILGEAMLSAIETSLQTSPTDSPTFIDSCTGNPESCPPIP